MLEMREIFANCVGFFTFSKGDSRQVGILPFPKKEFKHTAVKLIQPSIQGTSA